MRTRLTILVAVLSLALAGAALAGPEKAPAAPAGDVGLAYKASRTWDLDLPAERFVTVSGAFDFRKAGGARFVVSLDGDALAVDTDADGATDVRVTGKAGFVRLETKDFTYAVRLVNAGSGWRYAAGGRRVGKIGETRVTLIDQNGDGRYDGYGEDAMIVGRSKSACFLSRVVNVGGSLYSIEVAKDGSSIRHRPHTGPAGTIELASRWEAKAKLQSAIVRSEGGDYSFDLAKARALKVPAARYVLHSGKLGLGENVVRFTQGRAKPVVVKAGGEAAFTGGAPLAAEFTVIRQGGEIRLDPARLRYFGRAGEEYTTWKPFGKSPEFTVTDAKKGTEIAKAIFTGC